MRGNHLFEAINVIVVVGATRLGTWSLGISLLVQPPLVLFSGGSTLVSDRRHCTLLHSALILGSWATVKGRTGHQSKAEPHSSTVSHHWPAWRHSVNSQAPYGPGACGCSRTAKKL